jgi:hypothetical protein
MAVYNFARKCTGFDRDSSLSPCGRGWLAEPVGRGGIRKLLNCNQYIYEPVLDPHPDPPLFKGRGYRCGRLDAIPSPCPHPSLPLWGRIKVGARGGSGWGSMVKQVKDSQAQPRRKIETSPIAKLIRNDDDVLLYVFVFTHNLIQKVDQLFGIMLYFTTVSGIQGSGFVHFRRGVRAALVSSRRRRGE